MKHIINIQMAAIANNRRTFYSIYIHYLQNNIQKIKSAEDFPRNRMPFIKARLEMEKVKTGQTNMSEKQKQQGL